MGRLQRLHQPVPTGRLPKSTRLSGALEPNLPQEGGSLSPWKASPRCDCPSPFDFCDVLMYLMPHIGLGRGSVRSTVGQHGSCV